MTLTIRIPANTGSTSSSSSRSPQYISSDIASIDFRLTAVSPTGGGTYSGPLNTDTLVVVSYGSGNCTLVSSVETCTVTTTAPAPATDTWTIYTYGTTTPTVGTTTPLSVYTGYSLATTVAGPNNAVVATWGVPSALAFSPAIVGNVAANVALTGGSALTTSLQVQDAGGATLIGGNNFSSVNGTAGNVSFTGCSTNLTPTPATIAAANPTALGSGTISIAYNGLSASGSVLYCYANAISGLGATFAEYGITTAGSNPQGIVNGPDGDIWFTEASTSKIGKMTTAGSMVAEYPTTTSSASPQGITVGPDGNLWFAEGAASKIAKITTAGVVTEYPVITAGSNPIGITSGPDGNLWFTEFYSGGKIGKITTAGVVTEYATTTSGSQPIGMTSGPDGNLWFVESATSKVGKITTAGAITEYATTTASSRPQGITSGPDGNLWVTESSASKIAKVTTAGVFTEYPTLTTNSSTGYLVTGPDGNLWFTEPNVNKVAKITTGGAVVEYPSPTNYPIAITVGSDNLVWFTENGVTNRIAKTLTLSGGNLTAQYGVFLTAGTGSDNWTVTSKARRPGR